MYTLGVSVSLRFRYTISKETNNGIICLIWLQDDPLGIGTFVQGLHVLNPRAMLELNALKIKPGVGRSAARSGFE